MSSIPRFLQKRSTKVSTVSKLKELSKRIGVNDKHKLRKVHSRNEVDIWQVARYKRRPEASNYA